MVMMHIKYIIKQSIASFIKSKKKYTLTYAYILKNYYVNHLFFIHRILYLPQNTICYYYCHSYNIIYYKKIMFILL